MLFPQEEGYGETWFPPFDPAESRRFPSVGRGRRLRGGRTVIRTFPPKTYRHRVRILWRIGGVMGRADRVFAKGEHPLRITEKQRGCGTRRGDRHSRVQSTPCGASKPTQSAREELNRLDTRGDVLYGGQMGAALQYMTDEAGHKTAVVLPIADYKRLLEDINDLAAVADRREEPTIPHDQFVQELRKDGLLPD